MGLSVSSVSSFKSSLFLSLCSIRGTIPPFSNRGRSRNLSFVKLLSKNCKTPLKELTRSRKFQQPALANLWKSSGKSFLRKQMAWL
jgi:hypothetical protein